MVIEFVPPPDQGRRFSNNRKVRLSDCGPDSRLRLDGLARYCQDVATDDWDNVGAGSDLTWVVRRTAVRVVEGGRWPRFGERVVLTTWCGGTGAAWAERRTSLCVGDDLLIDTASLWVPLNASGLPQRLPPYFLDLYGEAAQGRKVSGRVTLEPPPEGAPTRPWPLRRADFDVVDHVNNAAIWQAATEAADTTPQEAMVTFHGALLEGDRVDLVSAPGRMWLVVDGDVRVSARFSPA
jgi:acyl-ACP thioesterase